MTDSPRDTPMMRQYRQAKEAHPGMLLLFRMGDFFEMFDEDAEVASRVLGLTLTSRDKQIPMAGFPHHQLEGYLQKLLHAGFRVAVCDQVEVPALAKGLVRREVTRVITPEFPRTSLTALVTIASNTGCTSVCERLMTRRMSLVAVCVSSAVASSRLLVCNSVNSRTFSIAITAWSAKV